MVQIVCPECNSTNEALGSCVKCGFPLNKEYKICNECGELNKCNQQSCNVCGFPFISPQPTNISYKSKTAKVWGIVLVVLAVLFIGVSISRVTSSKYNACKSGYSDAMREYKTNSAYSEYYGGGLFGSSYGIIADGYGDIADRYKSEINKMRAQSIIALLFAASSGVVGVMLIKKNS